MTFPEWLSQRLKRPLPGRDEQMKMMPLGSTNRFPIPDKTRKSSVLILLFPDISGYSFLVIKRSADGGVHSSQISFPGGKIEAYDASPEAAALREAYEEVNLDHKGVRILGRMSPLYIPVSRFEVLPIIAFQEEKPMGLVPAEAEVAEILTVSMDRHLAQKETREVLSSAGYGISLSAPVYKIDEEHFIWGATAMILAELEALWRAFLQSKEP